MVYAIPSYKRQNKQETAKFLHELGISPSAVFIFVNSAEYDAYRLNYRDICTIVQREEGENTIPVARNYILDYFKGREDVVMMDDDISCISVGNKTKDFVDITTGDQLTQMFEKMFIVTRQLYGFMFGVYPVYNNFFMNNDISTKVTVNTILGFPKNFPYRFNERYVAKEDIELCGRIIRDGGNVIRFNNVAYKAKHRTNEGGACDMWKTDANERMAKELTKTYPKIFAQQKNKPQEVRVIMKDVKKKGIAWNI